ncbi:MAG: hypothetical protein GY940_35465 [bacterium]|nr:hypothetical protein [bacterium]
MFVNHSSKEVTAKIVYYGPGLSGKTSNLQYIFSITNPKTRGELISIETEIERTLFFDLLPINVGLISGYQTKFQLYTVPGQVFYDSTRQLVLKGADGIVFVADSQELMKTANLESLENLRKNLASHKQDFNDIPVVFQFNKRDLGNTLPEEELSRMLNHRSSPYYGAVAIEGKGVLETLREISGLILKKIKLLLEGNTKKAAPAPPIDFDTNDKNVSLDKENIPVKTIQAEEMEVEFQQVEARNRNADIAKAPTAKEVPHNEEEEELKVETVEPGNDFSDLEELVLGEDISQVDELTDLQEIEIDDVTDESADTNPLDEPLLDQADSPDPKKDPAEDTNELDEDSLVDIKVPANELEEHTETDAFELDAGEGDAFELGDIDDENLTVVEELPDLGDIHFESESEIQIEADQLTPQPIPPASPTPPERINQQPPQGIDLLNRFKDNTRVTVIRDVRMKGHHFSLDIKDKESNLLDTINVEITPETKKVTLIIDVKK